MTKQLPKHIVSKLERMNNHVYAAKRLHKQVANWLEDNEVTDWGTELLYIAKAEAEYACDIDELERLIEMMTEGE